MPDSATLPRATTRRWLARTSTAVVLAWAVFVLLNLVISGHWSLWLVFSLVPPLAFPLLSLAVLALAAAGPSVLNRRAGLAIALVALLLSLPQSGLLVPWSPAGAPGPTIRIMSWNTEYWDQTDDPAAFFGYLRDQHADVYLLQEYLHFVNGQIVAIDDMARLRAEFPDYQVIVKGELLTLSRLPVLAQPAVSDDNVLRVDVRTPQGAALTTYNTHIPAQLDPTASPLSLDFYRVLGQRHTQRAHAYQALAAAAGQDQQPGLIAGDFNTTAAMGELDLVSALGSDAAASAGHSPYPVSWNQHGLLPLWRLDWGFVRNGLIARDYRLLDAAGMSDHRAQLLDLTVEAP